MVYPRASGMHPVDSMHVNVGFVKTENPAKIRPKLHKYDRLMVLDINLGTCHNDSIIDGVKRV